jgi:hypothetical protein
MYRAKQTPAAGAIFALGSALLFWTRPYEGGAFALILLIVFAQELWRTMRTGVLVAAVSVLVVCGAWTGYYNRTITGNPFRLPYLLYYQQHNTTPAFWFLPLAPQPVYSNPRLAGEHGTTGWEAAAHEAVYKNGHLRPDWLWTGITKTVLSLDFSVRIALLLALLVPAAWRDSLFRKIALVAAVSLLAVSVETFHFEHYTAPAWGAFALLIAIWAQHAWNLRVFRQPVGPALVVLALAWPAINSAFIRLPRLLHRTSAPAAGNSKAPQPPDSWPDRRVALLNRLAKLDRRQLVIVRYPSPDWKVGEEWVYNGADIDQQRVVLAHDLGTEENRVLLNYYPDRTPLLLAFDPATDQEQIIPYPR